MQELHIKKSYYAKDDYIRNGTIRRVIDGDTFEVVVDCGFRRYSVERLRLYGVDAPEMRGENKAHGEEAKEAVMALLPVGSDITFKSLEMDSFGRWLADIYFQPENIDAPVSLAEYLLEHDYATAWK